ncbi:hypothetical protein CR513_07599, partial [Mucuna pruriens]
MCDVLLKEKKRSERLKIIRYCNSNFVGCQDSKCSMSAYVYILVEGTISWKFVKHTFIVPSTMTAEFVACFEVVDALKGH